MKNENAASSKNTLLAFAAKSLVFFVIAGFALQMFMPSFQDIKEQLTDRNKLYLLGLVQNPVSLYKASEWAESQGLLEVAKRDMELAIGIVELHATDKQVLKRYTDRLDELKRKIGK